MGKVVENLKSERSDLNDKISLLSKFLDSFESNSSIKVSPFHIELLRMQLNVMSAYSRILTLRLEDFGEKVNEIIPLSQIDNRQ